MSRARHTEAEIIAVLKQVEAGRKAEDVAREAGVDVDAATAALAQARSAHQVHAGPRMGSRRRVATEAAPWNS